MSNGDKPMIEELSLIDTDILSYMLKGMEPAQSQSQIYFQKHKKFTISTLTYYESLRGYKASNATRRLKTFHHFLRRVELLDVDKTILDKAAEIYAYMKPRGILPGEIDVIIGATAIVHDLWLITNNTSHYQPISDEFDLKLSNWMHSK
ncbi:MAG: type II toxin-antitoxin system VapC family toxin [Chloroflexota bacterium]